MDSEANLSDAGMAASDKQFKDGICALIPFLRAFARTLCGNRDYGEDLAQEALVRAWQFRQSFEPGTNLKAWLFTILRNHFYSDLRRKWRTQPWDAEVAEQIPDHRDTQNWTVELSDAARALALLPAIHREALILIAAEGLSYEAAAAICGCAVGTVKSRVSRARGMLLSILDGDETSPLLSKSAAPVPVAGICHVVAKSSLARASYVGT